jgi:murein DD-endopeptidase MepM/ murein hydrolase activator NlpD
MCLKAAACAALLGATLGAAACARSAAEPHHASRPDIDLVPDSQMTPGHVRPGENLGSLLGALNLGGGQAEGVLASIQGVFDPRRMRVGQAWRLRRADDGAVRLFEYEIDGRSVLRVLPRPGDAGEFVAVVAPYDVRTTAVEVEGRIDERTPSLFAAMSAVGEQPDLSLALADIFSGEVDFNSDLQTGDSFRLVTDKSMRDGRFVGYGPVTAAALMNDGRRLLAFRFQPAGGKPGYYDAEGRSLTRFFLRSPLKFDPQVSSAFSRGRMHPILHIRRAHLGVDYRAQAGAPVVAVATGTVVLAGWTTGGGRTVRIRHARGYESGYLHLSAFGPGIHSGARVGQGQLIGRVGATGLATGPHLHFELRKAGVHVNPQTERKKLPPGEPIPAGQLQAFRTVRDGAVKELGFDLTASSQPPQTVGAN